MIVVWAKPHSRNHGHVLKINEKTILSFLNFIIASGMWPPNSPDANPDFAFWLHIEGKACPIHHLNIEALKATVNEVWDTICMDYIQKTCKSFRRRLEAIVEAGGGYIE